MKKQLIVIKIGTSSLVGADASLAPEKVRNIVRQVADLRDAGHSVVIVTSGSIAAGWRRLGYGARPSSVAARQACAACGQGLLMEEYNRFLCERGYSAAQLLVTRGDLADRRRFANAFNALEVLIKKGAVPVINENDTVAVEELKLGDNDTLGAYVAAMLHADLLLILTDVDGLYTADPSKDKSARLIERVERITPQIEAIAAGAGTTNGTGGMKTKLAAAKLATRSGVPTFITSSADADAILHAVAGEARGTLFEAKSSLKNKQQWVAFFAHSAGNLYVDEGAARAVTDGGHSLLPAGICALEGDFRRGDVVNVFRAGSHEYLGRGVVQYSRDELDEVLSGDAAGAKEAIHRDDWAGE